jgi:hypothetical protein
MIGQTNIERNNNMSQKITWFITAIFVLILVLPNLGAGQSKPINIALINPIQIFPEGTTITGIRLNIIYGKNISMTGIDFGLVNHIGTGGFTGVQWGLANLSDGNFVGFQNGLLNITNNNVEGFQLGWYNKGNFVNGLQIGLVNYAGSMKGLQIGIINIIKKGGQFPVFPIVNWSF